MKHDFRSDPSSDEAAAFLDWLRNETVESLRRDYGNIEATVATIFLYVNRAYEAGLTDNEVGGLFGKCVVQADYTEEEGESVFAILERQGEVAKQVHSAT